jgi:transposase
MIPAIVERCAGIDVGKSEVAVCLMTGAAAAEPRVEYRNFKTFTAELEQMRDWLVEAGCTHVLMESTGSYWKPIFNVLEEHLKVYVANAEDVKGRKGHKTDKQDSWWLAHLFRHGMVRTSFIPPRPIRELRDLTRRRRKVLGMATSEKNRIAKVLEDANVKLGSVLSNLFGVSGQLMLEALLEDKATPEQIAQFAQRRAREKIPQITASLEGHRMSEHHRLLIRMSLEVLRCLEGQIIALDTEILQRIERHGYLRQLELIESVPGIQRDAGVVILAETGGDMRVFPTEQHLSSWAGVCPGNKRSAGKDFRGHITRGNRWLRSTLTQCAWAVAHSKGGPLREKFWRLAVGGAKKAVMATAHAQLRLVYRVLSTGQPHSQLPAVHCDQARRLRMVRHHLRCLGRLGISTGPMLVQVTRAYRCSNRQKPQPQLTQQ